MPETNNTVTFRSAISAWVANLREFVIGPAGSEVAAVLVMMVVVVVFTAPLALFADTDVTANGAAPVNPCAADIAANSTTQTANQVKVSDATASGNAFDIYTGRSGGDVKRVSQPLSVQNGLLPPNMCLGTVVSDLVRSDGEVIPSNQVTSWAVSGNAGLRIFIYVEVSPRYGSVTPAGGYKGTVSMDDERAIGGNIPLTVHIRYPRLWRATMVAILAAWVGFFWAWLIHLSRADIPTAGRFWLYVVLQVAILTIVAFPVVNAQILTNPDWGGDVSQYIALATLAGGGALATTPTLRALIDRAANFMPGGSGPSTDATDEAVPAVWPAGAPAGGDGDTGPTAAGGDGSSALATPQGGDGSSALATPAGGEGGIVSTPAANDSGALPAPPQGSDGSALPAPQDGGGPSTAPADPTTAAAPAAVADPADPADPVDPAAPVDPVDPAAPGSA